MCSIKKLFQISLTLCNQNAIDYLGTQTLSESGYEPYEIFINLASKPNIHVAHILSCPNIYITPPLDHSLQGT